MGLCAASGSRHYSHFIEQRTSLLSGRLLSAYTQSALKKGHPLGQPYGYSKYLDRHRINCQHISADTFQSYHFQSIQCIDQQQHRHPPMRPYL